MKLKMTLLSLIATTMFAGAANAAIVNMTETQILSEDGQDMTFTFDNLLPSMGSGGVLTISSGINQANPGSFDGLDLNSSLEFFDLGIEGTSFGSFNCTGDGGHQQIPGANDSSDCDFSLPLQLADDQLIGFLADGTFSVNINFSDEVGAFAPNEMDEVIVSLSYDAIAQQVPVPATGLFLLGGVGFMMARSRRN